MISFLNRLISQSATGHYLPWYPGDERNFTSGFKKINRKAAYGQLKFGQFGDGSMAKKVSRKAQYARLKEQERARLLKTYQEGISNVEPVKLSKAQVDRVLSEKPVRSFRRITKKAWLEREMAKWEHPLVPSYRVQDSEAKVARYRQEFVQYSKNIMPSAFDELRRLVPFFANLFFHKTGPDYIEIIENLKLILLTRGLHYASCSPAHKWNSNYVWGEFREAFLSAAAGLCRDGSESSELISDDDIKPVFDQNYSTFDLFMAKATTPFLESARDTDRIRANFVLLHAGVYQWVEKYGLRYDWLLHYAYYFISQFSENPTISVEDIIIPTRRYLTRTMYKPFEFKSDGWWASQYGENVKEFETRITEEFEETLEAYIQEANSKLGLHKLPKATKLPTFENVEWAAYSVMRRWNAEKIVERFFSEISANRTNSSKARRAFKSKIKCVNNGLREVNKYGIPLLT